MREVACVVVVREIEGKSESVGEVVLAPAVVVVGSGAVVAIISEIGTTLSREYM